MSTVDSDFDALLAAVRAFRDERDWARFHNAKDLALSVSIEAAELLEHFQWKDRDEVDALLRDADARRAIADEMADVLLLLASMSDAVGVDLVAAAFDKLQRNAEKYPVEKSRGRAEKYDRL